MTTLESKIERDLVKAVKRAGGLCLKWTSPGTTGLPDRILLLPNGRVVFVELKRPGPHHVAELQTRWRNRLAGLGFDARIVVTTEDMETLLRDMEAGG